MTGRPKGHPKSGGRQPGTKNKASVAREAAITASGLTPLDYMLTVLRDPLMPPERRDEMAKAAAPYVHPRLAAIEHAGKDGGPIEFREVSDLDRVRALKAFMAKAGA